MWFSIPLNDRPAISEYWHAAVVFALSTLLSFSPTGADGDDYLSEISAEAEKVQQDVPVDTTETGHTQNEFEAEMKAQYMGSYTFYLKLPNREREEIYKDYARGAPIEQIRKKIMDRFLSR